MTEINQKTDQKVIDRVRKLLALAADGGATEAEASLAAERAREIMAAHGLSTAAIEMAGGTGEKRSDEELLGSAGEWWQPPLMAAIAESCFIFCERTYRTDKAGRALGGGYRLIGRESAVATSRVLYEYLCQTVRRVAAEQVGLEKPKWFRRGMSERLCERILDRHETEMRKQRAEADRRNAAATGGGNALVVVLEDFAEKEKDLNRDMKMGLPPGTTRQRREERERQRLAEEAAREEKRRQLEESGVDKNVAFYMAAGFTRARAEELCAPAKEKTAKERERDEQENRKYWDRHGRREEREAAKKRSPERRAGRNRGDEVGLDRQVDRGQTRKLS